MDATDAIKAGRRAAESLFIDRYRITRGAGEAVFNPDTGQYESSTVTVWEGKGKIQLNAPSAENPEAGGAVYTVQSMELHIPVNAGPVMINDTVTVLATPLDPHRVGDTLRVTALHRKTYATAQRLEVERTT